MGKAEPPRPAKVVVGIITAEPELGALVAQSLPWGTIDRHSDRLNFTFSDYYQPEMGANLVRFWLSFDYFLIADQLAEMKITTNRIEQQFQNANRGRRFNVDPGLVSAQNLILATSKPAAHRIYLRDGIFAEVTLVYRNQSFEPLAWTYPDYRTPEALRFFLAERELVRRAGHAE